MLFNSLEFAVFLPLVFFLYWFVVSQNLQFQNILLLIASYIFYGWWDWRFLALIIFSSLVDFVVGVAMENEDKKIKRKSLLLISIIINIGLLGIFKYYHFFIQSFTDAFTLFGKSFEPNRIKIILPVGISFYTFQSLSYSIDVYRRKLKPTKNIVAFFSYVAFFPQLVAGPIEKAKDLLPQFYSKRHFDYPKAVDGMRQILLGLFKKVVIADNCAVFVDKIFLAYSSYSSSTLLLGAILFSVQIYMDFSGYSDIAIGTARLFGFRLTQNFTAPYFSKNIGEFWRRWHISLSNWFKEYIYIPLGGNRVSSLLQVRNIFIVFLLSGLWHGANWTYLFWGFIHAVSMLPIILIKKYQYIINRLNIDFPFRNFLSITSTFLLVTFAFIFFRAENIERAVYYILKIFDTSLFSFPRYIPKKLILLILVYFSIEWRQRDKRHIFEFDNYKMPKLIRWACYFGCLIVILTFSEDQKAFIYFQF